MTQKEVINGGFTWKEWKNVKGPCVTVVQKRVEELLLRVYL